MTRGGAWRWLGACALLVALESNAVAWGPRGHALVAEAALRAAAPMPRWFTSALPALREQANAPDRWRGLRERVPALVARDADHFFDLDVWGASRLPSSRWKYVQEAMQHRLKPEDVGFLPWSAMEAYGVLVAAMGDVRQGRDGGREAALAAAGVLAHLVADAAVPLHATRHHHGWVGPNPSDFTRAASVHRWFESELVADVAGSEIVLTAEARRPLGDGEAAIRTTLQESLALVPRLYDAERRSRLERDDRPARTLVRERLRAAATLLARFWREAWRTSGA